jgi:hypothetical protein
MKYRESIDELVEELKREGLGSEERKEAIREYTIKYHLAQKVYIKSATEQYDYRDMIDFAQQTAYKTTLNTYCKREKTNE